MSDPFKIALAVFILASGVTVATIAHDANASIIGGWGNLCIAIAFATGALVIWVLQD